MVAAKERNELKSLRKTELGLETADDECKYDLVVYDNLYIINKHFSKKNRNFIFRNTYEH